MGLTKSKTINKPLGAFVTALLELTVAGNEFNIDTLLAGALSNAGQGGISVPLQDSSNAASDNTQGVMIYAIYGVSTSLFQADGSILEDANGNDVYVKIEKSGASYLAKFYKKDNGVESAFTLATGNYNLSIPYMFLFGTLPADAFLRGTIQGYNHFGEGGAAATSQLKTIVEVKAIVTNNVIPDLDFVPYDAAMVIINLDGWSGHSNTDFKNSIQVNNKAVDYIVANAGFQLTAGDEVFLTYQIAV
jgi:hypothetical protein